MKVKAIVVAAAVIGAGVLICFVLPGEGSDFDSRGEKRVGMTRKAAAPVTAPRFPERLRQGFTVLNTLVTNEVRTAEPETARGEQPIAQFPARPMDRVGAAPQRRNQQKKGKELEDPVARMALNYVGVDPDAEEYWLVSIFDESLPEKEREDLMEDLNEAGFKDPKHPTFEDVPLILSRLQIIEEVAPWADEFMAEHLGEAYKDLSNMLAGRGPQ